MQDKRQGWMGHVQAWEASGSSQAAYCRAHGLSLGSFGYWRGKQMAAAASRRTGLIPITVAPGGTGVVTVRLPNGLAVEVPLAVEVDVAGLAPLLRALAAC